MKTNFQKFLFIVSGIVFISALSLGTYAQGCKSMAGCKPGFYNLPGLTQEQTKKMDDLRIAHMKEVTPLKRQIDEKKARINTLTVAEKPDMAAINQAIDELGAIKMQLLKKKAQFHQDIRALLTPEQKVLFDAKADIFKKGCCGGGMGKDAPGCMHGGMGMGPGPNGPNPPMKPEDCPHKQK
jgi:Spy/CpxP family protein refolding chaperone